MTRDKQKQVERVARMEWGDFAERLDKVATRAAGGRPADDEAMRTYFGDQEYEELKLLAQRSRATRQRAPLLGNVVFLPGIMGSNLITTEPGGDQDLIWVNLLRIVSGQAERLRLTADASGDAGPLPVTASRIDKRTYARALLTLGARWRVQPFPFDWRRHIDAAADGLAAFIEQKFPGQPVHLVAHSMGGLVSRNFIRLYPAVWQAMRGDAVGAAGGRLVMMGTPNYGSFAIAQALTGTEKMVRWLEKVDLSHGMTELLGILNSFVGSYLMLPAPSRIQAELRRLYEPATWGSFPVSGRHLRRAREFHQALEGEPATIDPARMAYIAGCNQQTLLTMEIAAPGEFRYFTTLEGDGRVPFTLGRLKDVPIWYVEEAHGSLPKNERVLRAVDQILERGRTDALPASPIPPRAFFVERSPWHRSLGDYLVESELERIARRAEAEQANAEEIRFAEETLTRALAGETRPARKPEPGQGVARATKRRKLVVEVVQGDVTQVAAPVVAVGSYKGVTPAAALAALDRALDFWISRAIQNSMLGAELGQVFLIPVQRGRHRVAAGAVLVAGMGEEGRFDRHDLRYLALNVTFAVSALRASGFATVLIGSGKGSLPLESAVQGLLFGVCDALGRAEAAAFQRLTIVEIMPERAKAIREILEQVKTQDSAAGLEISVTSSTLRRVGPRTEPPRPRALGSARIGARITVEREGDVFRFSALTQQAVIAMREVEIQSFYSERVAENLKDALGFQEQERYGRLLHAVLPQDFQEHYQDPLTIILDRTTAGFPWEMACYTRPEGAAYFGTHLGLTRQFRTLLSSRPGVAPPLDQRLRVLVVADPAPEPALQLPGARQEGQEVVRLLRRIRQETGLEIEVVGRIGWEECDPVEILALILDGNFDVIHFAGHGVFDPERPNRGGWVFGAAKDRPGEVLTLSAREIFLARRVPRLVFANACFSAVVSPKPLSAEEMNRRLAGIAEAFFERGVPNYLGAGWPVQDDLAVTFAAEFYARALTGRSAAAFPPAEAAAGGGPAAAAPATLAQAVASARTLIAHQGSTWGAYQHYGEADGRLIQTPEPGGGEAAARSRRPRPKPAAAPRKKRPRRAASSRRR